MNILDQFFEMFKPSPTGGHYFMWVILLFFIAAVAIMIERWVYLWVRSNISAERFMAEIRKLVSAGDFKKAMALCKSAGKKALPQVIFKALEVAERSDMVDYRAVQNAMDEASLEIIPRLNKRISWLSQLANIGTLTGLLGTIFGLIQSFAAADAAGGGSTSLAAGISVAMFTTMWGLTVAIPATIAYQFTSNKSQEIIDDIDEHSVKLIHLLTGAR
ncbi:MotA/TolQ/ExbB proton channel family protein [bacterium]|nr:MotA/TolQ/ExbB proton channel family protein [bacterium]